MSLIIIYFII